MAAQFAAARGARCSGIDAAEALLEIALGSFAYPRRRLPPGAIWRNCPFEDQSFDVVTGFNSFQYAGQPHWWRLSAARRVTKTVLRLFVIMKPWGDPDGMEAASLVAALRPFTCRVPFRARPASSGFPEVELICRRRWPRPKPVEIFDVECPLFPAYATERDEATAAALGPNSAGVARARHGEDIRRRGAVSKASTGPFGLSPRCKGGWGWWLHRLRRMISFRCLLRRL